MTLLTLLSKLERSECGSRELDFWLSVRVWENSTYTDEELQHDIALVGIEGMCVEKPFTSSIDAAIALVDRVLPDLEEARLQFSLPVGTFCNASLYLDTFTQNPDEIFVAAAKTPALAICLAVLRALSKDFPNDNR